MALHDSGEDTFTEDEVKRFYAVLEKEYKIGYKFDCPLRADLKSKYGMKGLNRLRDFTNSVLPQFPDYENTLPTLEAVIAATRAKQLPKAAPCLIVTCDEEEIEVNRRRRKSFGCSLL